MGESRKHKKLKVVDRLGASKRILIGWWLLQLTVKISDMVWCYSGLQI